MPQVAVTVQRVGDRRGIRRFVDLPHVLYRSVEGWHAPLVDVERTRLAVRGNPYFDEGDAAYLLARVGGRAAGRIVAHVARIGDADGRFGFLAVDPSEPQVVQALVDAAAEWLGEQGCTSMHGPVSWIESESWGVLARGLSKPVTGLPWHPTGTSKALVGAGLPVLEARSTHRVALVPTVGDPAPVSPSDEQAGALAAAGSYADTRLVAVVGAQWVAAVPDLSDLASSVGARTAWDVARRARRGEFSRAVVTRWDGSPDLLGPAIAATAAAAGYTEVFSPWPGSDRADPVLVHRLHGRAL